LSYDFSQLNDKEFECIVCDLVSKRDGVNVDRFKPGKDQGVDGRFFSISGETILQCKHYLKSGYEKMVSVLKKHEKNKVVRLDPERYIFVTSLPLSRSNKNEIVSIFKPYIKSEEDVIGQENLNDLLGSFPDIEIKHFKLWLSSTIVLQRLLNNAIMGRSDYELSQIVRKSKRFVPTEDFEKAKDFLLNRNVVILTGEPGIGKTTLAENLCLLYCSHGYEFIVIEESLSEAESVYDKNKKQLFYFDDFLGSNYLEAIEAKKDSHIAKFIERISVDPSKKFILTSRTNIFNMGLFYSSIFINKKIQKSEFILNINSISKFDKAKILYNHLWFSNLSELFIDQVYKDKRYWLIINHSNYSPRLVEFVTDCERVSEISENDYWDHVLETFDNPIDVWDNCFKVQSNQQVRNLVMLTVFNGGEISEDDLQNSFELLNSIQRLPLSAKVDLGFKSSSRLATRFFLTRNLISKKFVFKLYNPSISDYILNEFSDSSGMVFDVFRSLSTIKSIQQFESLKKEKIFSFPVNDNFILLQSAINYCKPFEYKIYFSYQCKDVENCSAYIKDIVKEGLDVKQDISNLEYFILLINEFWNEIDFRFDIFYNNYIDGKLDSDEVSALISLCESHLYDDENSLELLFKTLKDYIYYEVDRGMVDVDWSGYVDHYEGYEGDFEVVVDKDRIFNKLVEMGMDAIEYFNSELVIGLNIDIAEVLEDIDTDSIVSHIDYSEDTSWGDGKKGYDFKSSDIDDLFERDQV